ncbi:phosphate transporter [Kalaharituber pfeilii]|nr:phosphate transporter [Kalaharituber pfeilii]
MAALPQYDYIFAIAMLFSFLDAWGIGANDVANSFATTVSSRSITMVQAMLLASVCEFLGAVLAGSRVSDTIRNKIVAISKFKSEPEVLMLGMACALVASSTWLATATKFGMPVSTTHSTVGAVIGTGVAVFGIDGVNWSWSKKGVTQVLASWVIAPAIAGALSVCLFLVTKYGVLRRKDSLRAGFYMVPIYFALTSGVLTMLVVWKGAPSLKLDNWSAGRIVACILGVAGGMALLSACFLLTFLHRLLVLEDWTLKWHHAFLGPLLLKRGPVPPIPEGMNVQIIQDYYRGHATREQLEATDIGRQALEDLDHAIAAHNIKEEGNTHLTANLTANVNPENRNSVANIDKVGPWYSCKNLWIVFVDAFMHGVRQDVVGLQQRDSKVAGQRAAIMDMHARAAHFDNKTEHLYSFLQVLTAATASFAHGSNDLANATGPLAAVYLVWSTGATKDKSPRKVTAKLTINTSSAIVIGLWTYGYNVMRNLGNRLTLMSPSRGFSMELGAATAVVMASRLSIPISTTQCIVGAIVGVALCNGDLKALNWRMIAWCYGGWILTLPVTATISGVLLGIIINAPYVAANLLVRTY